MDYRLDYITRVFTKLRSKPLEKYVITRIWHLIDDLEIQLVPQQYVQREERGYALTDLYFPQINLHIEINEPAHYTSETRVYLDRIRKEDIIRSTAHEVIEVDCRGSIKDINTRVDIIVNVIKAKVKEQREYDSFRPWIPDYQYSVEHYKTLAKLRVQDDVQLRTIEEICLLFDAPFKKRGFLRPGATTHPKYEDVVIWWPSTRKRKGWINKISEDESIIIETNENENTRENHLKNESTSSRKKRYVFLHHRNNLGITSYRFKGVYHLDEQKTNAEEGVVWSRISEEVEMG